MSSSPLLPPFSDPMDPPPLSQAQSHAHVQNDSETDTKTAVHPSRSNGLVNGRGESSSSADEMMTPGPYDYQTRIVVPFEDLEQRNAQARKRIRREILEFMTIFAVWSNARAKFEKARATQMFDEKVNEIAEIEREHEEARKQFDKFKRLIKDALMTLNIHDVRV